MLEPTNPLGPTDEWTDNFLKHLLAERAASIYTQRNYRQALTEFRRWFQEERHQPPSWPSLQRDDFRSYLRFLGRSGLSRAAIRLRFSALRSFFKFLVRRGILETSPIKNIALPKLDQRLPQFLTAAQMLDLLKAPLQELELLKKASDTGPSGALSPRRGDPGNDLPCGLRISELCGLRRGH